jgi:hypothetical protein
MAGTPRHFTPVIEDDRFAWERDEAKIAREAALDGITVIRTKVPVPELSWNFGLGPCVPDT